MNLVDEYQRQFVWRAWPVIFDALPPLAGKAVLDIGCGIGDQAAELAVRGARVFGVDNNEELIRAAQARGLAESEFRVADLRELPDFGVRFDGLWCSFVAAYFPDLPAVLALWGRQLKPGGWLALTEIDNLFGHEPLSTGTKAKMQAYAHDAFAAGRYDFHMGHKLREHLVGSGFVVTQELTLGDEELSFDGPALREVFEAWQARFARMKLLHAFCGDEYPRIRDEFLSCLTRADHRSRAKVICCIATK